MPTDLRPNQSQWVIATLVLGMLGLATTTFLPEFATQTSKPEEVSKVSYDQSDLLYPSTSDAISKSLGVWSDPFEKIEKKLDFDKDPKPPTILDIIEDQIGSVGRLLVVAKVVSGSDSQDGIESRRRHRHAVELALGASGFSMRFPDRMTYVEAKYDYFHTATTATSSTIDLPLKLYSNSSGDAVLLVWIRDEHLGHFPMHSIAQITNSFLKPTDAIVKRAGFVVCGPHSSNTLSRINDEAQATRISLTDPIHRTTIDFSHQWALGAAIFNSVCTATNTSLKPNQLFIEFGETSKVRLIHTIGTDSQLTKLLRQELALRGRGLDKSSSRTVLFVEASSQKYIEGLKEEFESGPSNLTVIPYLRGVSDIDAKDNQISDYLDRTLAYLRNSTSESVAAVGVFGTQDNDKLRIFEAARSVFPTAAFFTTELDARYAMPKHLKSCRNLLVASHYGLGCQVKWVSDDMPSFRDGYQTSTFLSALIAMRYFTKKRGSFLDISFFDESDDKNRQDLFDICGRSNVDPSRKTLSPLLFEIGNSGPIQLTNDGLSDTIIRQPEVRRSVSGNLVFLARMLLFATILVGIAFVVRTFSNGLSNAIRDASATLIAVWYFFSEQRVRFNRYWNQLTQPAGVTGTATEPGPTPAPPGQDAQTIWFVCVVVLTVVGLLIAWASDVSDDGERITLLESTSVWPSVAMFHLVTILSTAIVLGLWLDLAKTQDKTLFSKGVLLAGLLFLAIFAALGFTWVDEPPARGLVTRVYAGFSLWLAAISLFLLASMSAISILKARKEIAEEAKTLRKFESKSDDSALLQRAQTLLRASAKYRQRLFNAMEAGERSSYTLMAPAALTILLAFARLPLLDSWGIPRVWYAALMTPMLLSILAALAMRSEARRLRYDVTGLIENQQSDLLGACANLDASERDSFNDFMQKVNQQLGLINRLDKGPFASVYSDPILGGVLLVITAGLTGPMRDVSTWIVNAFTGVVI